MLSINLAAHDLHAVVGALALTDRQLRQATLRAVNKTARRVKVQTARDTATALKLGVGIVKRTLIVERASARRLTAQVGLARGKGAIKAIDLGRAQQQARGVRVARRQYDRAFLAMMPQGHRGVFRRKSASRLPIQEVRVVITGAMTEVMERLSQRRAGQQLQKTLAQEIRFIRGTLG